MWGAESADESTQKWQLEYATEKSPNTSQTCTAARSVGDSVLKLIGDKYSWGQFPGFVELKK